MRALFSVFCILIAAQSYGTISVTDQLGRVVTIEQPAQRIVALAPHIVENLYSAGAGDRIVGAVDYCDYPESAKEIPRVGAISAFSLEAIVNQKPDLVVVWHSGRGAKIMEKLVKMGLVVYASNPKSIEDVAKSIRDYGVLTGNTDKAEKSVSQFEQILYGLREKYAQLSPISTFYQVWNDPIQTLNGEHIISDVIELCGGRNVFEKSVSLAPKISVESLIVQNPDVIIASGMGQERPEWLDAWRKWTSINAVKRENLYFVPPDLIQRHTVRILGGAALLCEHLQSARAKSRIDKQRSSMTLGE